MRAFLLAAHCLLLGVAGAAFAAEPVAPPTGAADNSQEIICRKEKETGSLIKTKKTCHSRAQWAYIDDTNQQFTRKMVEDNTTKSSGN